MNSVSFFNFSAIGAWLLAGSQQSAPYEPPTELMASALDQGAAFEAQASATGVALEIRINPQDKKMAVTCSNEQGDRTNFQTFPLGYYPTEITPTSDWGCVLIGGTNKFGTTRVMRYQLSDPGFGANGVPLDSSIVEIDEIFSASSLSETRDVYQILENQGAPQHCFVQFWNSRRVYDLDATTGQLQLVASSTDQPGIGEIVVPQLSDAHTLAYWRDHMGSGYVYFFVPLGAQDGASTVVLRDLDRNGVLDDGLSLTNELYASMGFGDPGQYLDD